MEVDVPADPLRVTAFGSDRVMLEPHDLADLVHESELGVRHDALDSWWGLLLKM